MGRETKARDIIDAKFLGSLALLDLQVRQASQGRIGGSRKTNTAGSSLDWLDHRPYIPGDDLKYLDWNLAGRFDRYYIKRYVDERQLHTILYIDLSASMDWREDENKCAAALRLAVALGYLSISHMDRLSLKLLRGSSCRDLCPAILDRDAFFQAASLLSMSSFGGDVDLFSAVQSDFAPGGDDGLSVIISDFMTDSDWRGAVDYLLSRRRQVALVQVLSAEELNPLYGGKLNLQDSEVPTGRDMRLEIDRAVLESYQKSTGEWLEEIAAFCKSRRVPYLLARSDERIEDIVLKKAVAAGIVR